MIKIALIGYGKMGQMIHSMAQQFDCQVIAIVDPFSDNENHLKAIESLAEYDIDVCIEFSNPEVVFDNIKRIANLKLNMVIGTTGWMQHLDTVSDLIKQNEIALMYGSNYSLGMNIFYQIINYSTTLLNKVSPYDVFAYEVHHNQKKDSPSGTAKEIAQIVLKNTDAKDKVVYDRCDDAIKPNEFHFSSIRGGSIPGTHVLAFDSVADTIELSHVARNREGFAQGALIAAKWLAGKKGVFNFKEAFGEILNV